MAFYAVGALGLCVQVVVLWILAGPMGLHYLAATAVAVELAVLHNFLWHERWTWRDRVVPAVPGDRRRAAALGRLARFHAANGLVSIWGNVVLTGLFVAYAGAEPVIGNVLAVVVCSLANFVAADRLVYSPLLPGGPTPRGARAGGPLAAVVLGADSKIDPRCPHLPHSR